MSTFKTKEKYPCLGTEPPAIAHCANENISIGGNKFMSWFDCKTCGARVTQIPKDGAGNDLDPVYFAVPPCQASDNYDPLAVRPTPEEARKGKIPPLSRAELKYRTVKEQPAYTTEEEQILAAARKILKEKTKNEGASSSGSAPTAFKSPPPPPPAQAKRPPPAPQNQGIKREQRDEQDMEYVTELDIQLMEEITALEQRANMLRMNMGSKPPPKR
jgi:hypothetical protein